MKDETVWLTRNQMAELFDRDVKTIGKHINNILKEEYMNVTGVIAKIATTGNPLSSSCKALLMCLPIVLTSLPNSNDS